MIGFLQSLAKLNLNDITERRIPLHSSPELDQETRKQFYTLASTTAGQELIREVVNNGQISGTDIVNIAYRKKQLDVFEQLLNGNEAIAAYRTENGVRQFGYGLNFVFNQPLEGRRLELVVQGHDLASAGKRADALLKTTGLISSLCLVEIKTPNTDLLESEPYRPACWQASKELSGGISQAQKTVQKTLKNLGTEFRPSDTAGNPSGEVLYSYHPKSCLIIGRLSEFSAAEGINREKFASFELLRRNTLAPEIITFDELLARAQFIVCNS